MTEEQFVERCEKIYDDTLFGELQVQMWLRGYGGIPESTVAIIRKQIADPPEKLLHSDATARVVLWATLWGLVRNYL